MHCLPDINIWIALSLPAHSHHRKALEWFESEVKISYFCRYTQQGTLRPLTSSAVTTPFGLKPLTNREALVAMDAMLSHERIGFAEEPDSLYDLWKVFADVSMASPKLWMDAYLAAFAGAGAYQLITTDKAFKQFKGTKVIILD